MTCRTMRQTLNSGSSMRPVTGMSRLIFPSLSLQKRDGQAHGQLGGLGAFHPVSEGELIDDDLVFRIELHVGDQVLEVEGEGTLLDFVSRIGA